MIHNILQSNTVFDIYFTNYCDLQPKTYQFAFNMATLNKIANLKAEMEAIHQDMNTKIQLLKEGIVAYNAIVQQHSGTDNTTKLLLEYLICIVGSMGSTKYTLKWTFHEIKMPKATGYRKANALKKKMKQSNLTYDQYWSTIQDQVSTILSNLRTEHEIYLKMSNTKSMNITNVYNQQIQI